MSPEEFKLGLILSGFAGLVLGLAMCILFGVLDVQCRNDPAGRFWNAETQHCQAFEVRP